MPPGDDNDGFVWLLVKEARETWIEGDSRDRAGLSPASNVLEVNPSKNLRTRFEPFGGADPELPPRPSDRNPPRFD